jgi:gliding motility-associated-like protein
VLPSAAGCVGDTAVYTFFISPLPIIVATADDTLCSGSSTQNIAFSSNVSGTTYSWTATGSSVNLSGFTPSGTGNIPAYTAINTDQQVQSISYVVTPSANGCNGPNDTIVFFVQPAAIAVASPAVQTLCDSATSAPILVSSTTNNVSFSWSLLAGNGILGLQQSGNGNTIPAMTLYNSGSTVLTAQYVVNASAGGCPGISDTVDITVFPTPNSVANPNPEIICPGDTTGIMLSSSVLGTSFNWNPTNNPQILGANAGIGNTIADVLTHTSQNSEYQIYTVIPTANGCPGNPITVVVEVLPAPLPSSFHDSINCIGATLFFVNTTVGGSTYQWSFGDGGTSNATNPQHVYANPGLYQIQLRATGLNGCSRTAISWIRIISPPNASFVITPDSGCAPLTTGFINTSQTYAPASSFNWNFGNGLGSNAMNPGTTTYLGSQFIDTTYFVTLIVSNMCGVDSTIDSVQVSPLPTSFFGTNVSVGCSPLTVNFSQNSIGQPTNYLWNFGNGNQSTAAIPPAQTFVNPGLTDSIFTITLTVSNACGSNSFSQQVLVKPNTITPFVNAFPTSGCSPLTVLFNNFTMGANSYSWDFDDGNFSTTASPTHTFILPGVYQVSLAANNGCSFDTLLIPITVNPPAVVSYSIAQDSLCEGSSYQLLNTSPSLSNIQWYFSDGQSSQLSNPVMVFNGHGSIQFYVVGTDNATGCTDTAFGALFIKPRPSVGPISEFYVGCSPLTTQFTDTLNQSLFHYWNFGDGSTSVQSNPYHVYSNSGNYQVLYIGENQFGCKDSAVISISVFPSPTASFSTINQSNCEIPASVFINNTSTGALSYQWDFGNGTTSNQVNPIVNYYQPGFYNIELSATNQYGCIDSSSAIIQIVDSPVYANFIVTPLEGCAPLTIQIQDSSIGATSYQWNFGDGTSSQQTSPQHTYFIPGSYPIQLVVSNSFGCNDTANWAVPIEVFPVPQAGFTLLPPVVTVVKPLVKLTDMSFGASVVMYEPTVGYLTDMGNGYYNINAIDSGYILVIQTVINEYGCEDTASAIVRINPESALYVPNSFTPNGNKINEGFRAKGVLVFDYKLEIFTRWGQLVFESNDLNEEWNGSVMNEGGGSKSDVYVWKIFYRDYQGNAHRKIGTVSLLSNDQMD